MSCRTQALGEDIAGIQLDQAKAHQAQRLGWGENLISILQPTHAPELNPAERFWQYLQAHLAGEPFTTLAQLQQRLRHISQRDLARPFRVARSFVETLLKRYRETASVEAKVRPQQTPTNGHNYVLTTGTGSGKSLSYKACPIIVPIVNHVLQRGKGQGIQAIVVYPMNALANSQAKELEKFLCRGYENGQEPVTFARYTGQKSEEDRQKILPIRLISC